MSLDIVDDLQAAEEHIGATAALVATALDRWADLIEDEHVDPTDPILASFIESLDALTLAEKRPFVRPRCEAEECDDDHDHELIP